jgi:hypothetical protein
MAREAMASWLPEAGVAYAWLPALGGRRTGSPDSPNAGLRQPQLRAYADHMGSPDFAGGIRELLDLAASAADRPSGPGPGPERAAGEGAGGVGVGGGLVVVMCAESLWWKCHRRLVADHLVLVAGRAVSHLFHDGRVAPHRPTPEARRDGPHVVYDVGVQRPLLDP